MRSRRFLSALAHGATASALVLVALACTAPTSHAPKAPPGLDSNELYEGPASRREGQQGTNVTYVAPPNAGTPIAQQPGAPTAAQSVVVVKPTPGADMRSPDPAALANANMRGANVSASRGQEGGVVVLWPRVIPSNMLDALRPQATGLQQRLREIVTHTVPGKPMDARPEPERVCPKAGCLAMSVGVLLATSGGGGCAAVAFVGRPGGTDLELIPWAGDVTLKQSRIGFRDAPESFVIIEDYESCDGLLTKLDKRAAMIEEAVRRNAVP